MNSVNFIVMKNIVILLFIISNIYSANCQDSTEIKNIYKKIDISNNKYFSKGYKIKSNNGKYLTKSYNETIEEADSLFKVKNYKRAVISYEIAFKENGNQGRISHRINAAICYTLIGNFDGAFNHLFRIAEKGKYNNNFTLEENHQFDPLHNDIRWNKLIDIVILNKNILEKQLTKEFVLQNQD
jgi:tetratricopeptide (TPR) repeat protein